MGRVHGGIPIRRYRSRIDPLDIVPDIDAALRKLKADKGYGTGGSWKSKPGKTPNWGRKDRTYLNGKQSRSNSLEQQVFLISDFKTTNLEPSQRKIFHSKT